MKRRVAKVECHIRLLLKKKNFPPLTFDFSEKVGDDGEDDDDDDEEMELQSEYTIATLATQYKYSIWCSGVSLHSVTERDLKYQPETIN